MDKLWAPWRITYLKKILKKTRGCVFCKILKEKKDTKNFIFARSQFSFAVLNLYPYNNGHVLLLPSRHVKELKDLNKDERGDLLDLLDDVQGVLQKVLKPEGFNIGLNIGKAAGAGFPGHVHIHVVPRWEGDVNFMPVIGDTKVISQSLESLYNKLMHAYKK